ncbi:hypothetical protein C1645_233443 [Glomus cerebriforme]|uniref:Uncharacterized protein n=1 Tax=Glomus cerebriforme TaxID=658196 RepID=A0A397SXU7_9GLOM|nr:hypothetical protein C1645_233443 [Glomus cerebriforme]
MYHKGNLHFSYHKRARITCSLLSSSSFPRIFRYIILISLSLFLFTIFYLNFKANQQILSEQHNYINSESENTPHTHFETSSTNALEGHTYVELLQLESTWNPTLYKNAPVTIIINNDNNDQKNNRNIDKQLDAIFSQTVKPESIWITTSAEQEENVNKLLKEKRLTDIIQVYIRDDNSAYLQIVQQKVQTKYILLLNYGVILGNQYLQNMLYVSNTKEYNNTLLGTMGVNLSNNETSLTCYEDHITSHSTYSSDGMIKYSRTSIRVDMLTNIWFLQKQWIPILFKERDAIDLPLEFLISITLQYHSNIPSIILPTLNQESWGDVRSTSIQPVICNNLRRKFSSNTTWKHYIERGYPLIIKETSNQNKIMIILDGIYQEKYFRTLYCKLSLTRNNSISIITTGNDRGLNASELRKIIKNEKSLCGHIDVYDLDINNNNNIRSQIYKGVGHMIEYLRPEILIYAKVTKNSIFQGISSSIEGFIVTTIKLPLEEIEFITELMIDLPFSALKKWNEPKIQLQIITQNRPDSLSRLINSLNTSYYFGDDNISLTVNMDRGADPVTMEFCLKFLWNHGSKNVRHRVVQGGLLPAVMESYYPNDYNDYGILLEDDVEVSPFYYLWIKYTILKYRYGPDKHLSQRLFGISLYGQRQMELHIIGRRPYDPESIFHGTKFPDRSPYLSQVPCSWGAVYFPEIWREFHDFLVERLDDETKYHLQDIIIPNSRSSFKWKKSWKKYLIELIYLRGYVMLYPNFKNFTSFSTNHAEIGIHIHRKKDKPDPVTIFGVPLMKEFTLYDELPNNHLTDFTDLPVTDLWGNLTTFNDLINRGINLHNQISQCPPHFKKDDDLLNFSTKDILCVDEEKKRIAIQNYEKKHRAISSVSKILSDVQINLLELLINVN